VLETGTTYLLDTCVLSELSKKDPDPTTVVWLDQVTNVAVPMGALIEIERGIHLRKRTSVARAAELREWFETLLTKDLPFRATDHYIARLLGAMLAVPALNALWIPNPQAKEPRYGQDLHIAATAIVCGYAIATYDVHDFLLINRHFPLLGLYNPREGRWYVQNGHGGTDSNLSIP
jgi:toxin FitB